MDSLKNLSASLNGLPLKARINGSCQERPASLLLSGNGVSVSIGVSSSSGCFCIRMREMEVRILVKGEWPGWFGTSDIDMSIIPYHSNTGAG